MCLLLAERPAPANPSERWLATDDLRRCPRGLSPRGSKNYSDVTLARRQTRAQPSALEFPDRDVCSRTSPSRYLGRCIRPAGNRPRPRYLSRARGNVKVASGRRRSTCQHWSGGTSGHVPNACITSLAVCGCWSDLFGQRLNGSRLLPHVENRYALEPWSGVDSWTTGRLTRRPAFASACPPFGRADRRAAAPRQRMAQSSCALTPAESRRSPPNQDEEIEQGSLDRARCR